MAESARENQSIYRFRWIGYGFLLFALIDSALTIIPPNFAAPSWKLQVMGKLVETVAVPLLGFGLIFFGEFYDRKAFEKVLLKILSWLCLVLAIAFLLLIPMGIIGAFQVDSEAAKVDPNAIQQQVLRQAAPTLTQIKQLEDQLNKSGPEDIKKLGSQLGSLGITFDTQDPEKAKADLLNRVSQLKAQAQGQIQRQVQEQVQTAEKQRLEIRKNALKWNLGALIAATLFFVLWKSTRWAR
ncbi:HpsJ family protein [Leptothermofonsia sp. ETS-13]|uniref:HpsJ-like protein, cyanoexosortase A-associated n=1 Tax=Leptothermofonsia sp. ETS-13 TaxID=3035696 RepID=UPI003B9E6CB0